MSSDRELLKLAAKAAGLLPLPDGKELDYTDGGGLAFCGGGEYVKWDPLTDDSDALRLAVKLGIEISFINGDTHANDACEGGPDKLANTRNAIVRAAAAIGEPIP